MVIIYLAIPTQNTQESPRIVRCPIKSTLHTWLQNLGGTLGASASVLRISALGLVYSTQNILFRVVLQLPHQENRYSAQSDKAYHQRIYKKYTSTLTPSACSHSASTYKKNTLLEEFKIRKNESFPIRQSLEVRSLQKTGYLNNQPAPGFDLQQFCEQGLTHVQVQIVTHRAQQLHDYYHQRDHT